MQGSTSRIGVIDWRNKEAADYYVNRVIGVATATDKHIDGVFVDSGFPIAASPNLTYASRKSSKYSSKTSHCLDWHAVAVAVAALAHCYATAIANQ